MIKVTSYEAADGKLFKTEEECRAWEKQLLINETMERLQENIEQTDHWSYGELKFEGAEDLMEFVRKHWHHILYIVNNK